MVHAGIRSSSRGAHTGRGTLMIRLAKTPGATGSAGASQVTARSGPTLAKPVAHNRKTKHRQSTRALFEDLTTVVASGTSHSQTGLADISDCLVFAAVAAGSH